MEDLFLRDSSPSKDKGETSPLADRVRPKQLDEVKGQDHLVGTEGPIRHAVSQKRLHSFILWGPPGCGKTTLARIVAEQSGFYFVPFSAVLSGIKEVREVMTHAEKIRKQTGKQTVLFIDEIHRFNKAQQDAFLPFVERGDIILIGATTENPSFEVISALLSRLRVYVVNPLSLEDLTKLLERAVEKDLVLKSKNLQIQKEVFEYIALQAAGDARVALNLLEACASLSSSHQVLDRSLVDRANQRVGLLYDKVGEEHYNVISAFHKSMRNGDSDAALYWLGRMLEAGEDPLYVARRMVRFASEDVGNADPQALVLAIAARDAIHFLGLPEGKLALAQLAVYLAHTPKSNSIYRAYGRVEGDLRKGHVYPVPLVIRNAPTHLMKELGYGKDYEYAHDFEEKTTGIWCLPEKLQNRKYYEPEESGFEKEIKKRKQEVEQIRLRLRGQKDKKNS